MSYIYELNIYNVLKAVESESTQDQSTGPEDANNKEKRKKCEMGPFAEKNFGKIIYARSYYISTPGVIYYPMEPLYYNCV